ncbi:hypothetical protein BU16DRAFT_23855 [Lophium mytilinum]|uniref:Uncharacterized protein n=1 Tax=Lophium mytilinum TaxID=390894 RepID=A0A6A6RF05_9PEZI|nr:hypothetical protein BU16DRAFT_23855 [Lophium mytilinum]
MPESRSSRMEHCDCPRPSRTRVIASPFDPKMCHFALHIWKCGDSFFTKYSSCSFDRAVHDTSNLLNPLHQFVRPHGRPLPCPPPSEPDLSPRTCHATPNTLSSTSSSRSSSNDTPRPRLAVPTIDLSSPGRSTYTIENNPSTCARDAKTGELIPIAMEQIGKMSDINQNNLGESGKCYVFEVVLQRRESTICPFCARSPNRRRLPAHARGCFAFS